MVTDLRSPVNSPVNPVVRPPLPAANDSELLARQRDRRIDDVRRELHDAEAQLDVEHHRLNTMIVIDRRSRNRVGAQLDRTQALARHIAGLERRLAELEAGR